MANGETLLGLGPKMLLSVVCCLLLTAIVASRCGDISQVHLAKDVVIHIRDTPGTALKPGPASPTSADAPGQVQQQAANSVIADLAAARPDQPVEVEDTEAELLLRLHENPVIWQQMMAQQRPEERQLIEAIVASMARQMPR